MSGGGVAGGAVCGVDPEVGDRDILALQLCRHDVAKAAEQLRRIVGGGGCDGLRRAS